MHLFACFFFSISEPGAKKTRGRDNLVPFFPRREISSYREISFEIAFCICLPC